MKISMHKLASIVALCVLCLAGCDTHTEHSHSHAEEKHTTKSHASEDVHAKDEHSEDEHSEDEHSEDGHSAKHGDKHDDDHSHDSNSVRQTDSHVHGNATLAIAQDGNKILIEFESPLYNLVGFEHAPENEVQQLKLVQAEAFLRQPAKLFAFNDEAGCQPLALNNTVSLMDTNEHSEEHHEASHNDDEHGTEKHSETLLEYQYICNTPENLSAFTTQLFTLFPKLSELDAIYLGSQSQKHKKLSPSDRQFSFK